MALDKKEYDFIVVGSGGPIDDQALAKVAKTGKFRGILIDAYRHPPPKNGTVDNLSPVDKRPRPLANSQ